MDTWAIAYIAVAMIFMGILLNAGFGTALLFTGMIILILMIFKGGMGSGKE